MAVKKLITPFEAVKFSQAGRDYPTEPMCQMIPQIEQEFGAECLGKTLYKWLQDNLATVPTGAEEWSCEQAYAEDDYAIRNGCLFISLIDDNIDDPLDSENWEVAERFENNDCANEMWTEYLRPILANKLFASSLTFTTMRANAGGLTVLAGTDNFNSQGFRSAKKDELADVKNAINQETERVVRNLIRWAKDKVDNDATCTVPLNSILICNGLCKPPSNSVRRWGFQH